jgi:N-acetylneuraminic acid mutarotase
VAPSLPIYDNVAFSIGNVIYMGFGHDDTINGYESQQLKAFNPNDNSTFCNIYTLSNGARTGSSVFVINNKAYIIGGENFRTSSTYLRDVWEFDPSKPALLY